MTADSPPEERASRRDWVLACAVLLSAWLLFQIQPMAGKRILPWFGGGPAVWMTTMLFFQVALLGGYVYAHLSVRYLPPRRQAIVHAALLAMAGVLLAIGGAIADDSWKPPSNEFAQLEILAALSATIGLPFVMLAATAPLAQAWFGRMHEASASYRLYALSNLGSLAALISYPFIVEPLVGIETQGVAWSLLFVVFAALCILAGWMANSTTPSGQHTVLTPVAPFEPQPLHIVAPSLLNRFYWIALPACASAMLLAVTNYLCQDIASLPLIWIAPLAIYLVTFIIAFDSDRWYRRWAWLGTMAAVSFIACGSWRLGPDVPIVWQVAIHLTLLLAVGMVCHGEVARLRPGLPFLTSYYLHLAAGGAIGGILVAIVSPIVFVDYYELPLGILAAWALAMSLLATDPHFTLIGGQRFGSWVAIFALFFAVALMAVDFFASRQLAVIASARNFFGVLRVQDAETPGGTRFRRLIHGRISHGSQLLDEDRTREAIAYFSESSGIGQLLRATSGPVSRRVGVIGLGVGTLAAYGDPGDKFRFYEIDPQVIEFADRHFTYLADARQRGVKLSVIANDARLALEREPPQQFDFLVLDAFSGDAVPIHLLTAEAFEVYLRHLRQGASVLAVQITNKHLDLAPVMKAAADRYQLDAMLVASTADEANAIEPATWILLYSRDAPEHKNRLGAPLSLKKGQQPVLWTDDYSSVLGLLKSK